MFGGLIFSMDSVYMSDLVLYFYYVVFGFRVKFVFVYQWIVMVSSQGFVLVIVKVISFQVEKVDFFMKDW